MRLTMNTYLSINNSETAYYVEEICSLLEEQHLLRQKQGLERGLKPQVS